ncbi:helicase HerA domain-containing protein [Vulcanisaeta sp. JCM 16161]|uniref:helicase HerA domain-containing protein n=1 Tax=Vulcanisaeta sp. JCM 16161 TaxID=1295372 RepID=UPI00406C9676
MQRGNVNDNAISELGINKLGDILGIVEKSINENSKLILTVSSGLSYNDLISKLFIGSYIVVIDSSTGNEVLLRVNKVESTINPPLSVRGTNSTYVRIVGDFVISRIKENGSFRYTSLIVIPINGSLVIYPSGEVIKEFLGLTGNISFGKALINRYDIPITLNEDVLSRGLLIMGQPGCGKSFFIKRLVKELYSMSGYENIVILDRTGEYTRDLVENGIDTSVLIPVDLMKLGRPVDIDELKKYIADKLRILGFQRKRVRISMSMSKGDGIEFNVEFQRKGFGRLSIMPLSIRFRWFIERTVNYLDPEIKYVVTTLMMENEKALDTVQGFISAVKDPELLNMIGRGPINKAIDLAYSLKGTGLFDAMVNIGGENIDISVFSPIRVLRSRVAIIDLHELPDPLMNIYETILIEDIIRWFIGSRDNKVIMVVDNAEGLMGNKDLLNSLINNVRIGRSHGIFFIVATRLFSKKLYREFGNLMIMRMNGSMKFGCQENTNLLNNEFILISPWLNISCIKGSIA